LYKEGFDIDFNLHGKTAVITGAANGIGKAIAIMFARKGVNTVLVDLSDDVEQVTDTITRLGYEAVSVVADITDNSSLEYILQTSVSEFGRIDVLVNCAGVAMLEDAEKIPEAWWDKTLDINLKASFMLSQAIGIHMIQKGGGKIISLASQASVIALERHVAYCSSKAGLVAMTQVLAVEWAKYNITVNAISPTVVLTELGEKAWAGQLGEDMKKQIPAGRFAYPEEVAACAAYLASDAADMITGANIVLDGGYTVK